MSKRDMKAEVMAVATNAATPLAADDTYVLSGIIDRQTYGMAQSALAEAHPFFTSAAGAGGATNTLTLALQHGDESDGSDMADYDTDTDVYAWAANGANNGHHSLPVDLKAAKRYLRVRAKLTEAGTITVTLQYIPLGLFLLGMDEVPNSNYVAAGYETKREAA